MRLTPDEIEAGRSPSGGFTKAQLAQWGIPWPPPKGWKDALMAGVPTERTMHQSVVRPSMDANELLRKVVLAIVEHGHASDLYDYPDVLAFFGAQIPPAAPSSDAHTGIQNVSVKNNVADDVGRE